MAKKSSMISINAIDQALKENAMPSTVNIEWCGLNIEVQRKLPIEEVSDFVKVVVSSCFDSNTGEYVPLAREIATRLMVLSSYANIRLPKSIDRQYEFAYAPGLYDLVVQNIDEEQFDSITNAISDRIRYEINMRISSASRDTEKLVSFFQQLYDVLNGAFENISADDVQNVVKAAERLNTDENQIVKLVTDTVREQTDSDTE